MSVSVLEIMERVKSVEPNRVIKYIEDCFDNMAMKGARENKVVKYNIVANRSRYLIPSEAVKVESVSVLYEENASELMETGDRTFASGSTNWTNQDFATFDTTTDLSVLCSAPDQYCYLDDDVFTSGKRYRLTYDLSLDDATAAFKLQTNTSQYELGAFSEGTDNVIEFTAPETSGFRIVGTGLGTGNFDNFSLKEMAVDDYREASRLVGHVSPNYFDEET